MLLQLSLASDPFQPAFVTCEECPANECQRQYKTQLRAPPPLFFQGYARKSRNSNPSKLCSGCRFTGDLVKTLKVMDGWCHVIATAGVNKQVQQPILCPGSITHLARRLGLSAEVTTIRQTPVVILQHTWAGQHLQGDAGSGGSALPTSTLPSKSHSLDVWSRAAVKEDPHLRAPLRSPARRRDASASLLRVCVRGRSRGALLISAAAATSRRRAGEPTGAKLLFRHERRGETDGGGGRVCSLSRDE